MKNIKKAFRMSTIKEREGDKRSQRFFFSFGESQPGILEILQATLSYIF